MDVRGLIIILTLAMVLGDFFLYFSVPFHVVKTWGLLAVLPLSGFFMYYDYKYR